MTEANHIEAMRDEQLKKIVEDFKNQPVLFYKPSPPSLIKVSEEFHFNGKGLWLGIERSIPPETDEVSEFLKARETLLSAFKAISGQTLTDFNTGQTSIPEINRAAERLEILIEKSETWEGLLPYWPDAVKYGLEEKYEKRLKELQNK